MKVIRSGASAAEPLWTNDDPAEESVLETALAAELNETIAHDGEKGGAEKCSDYGALAPEQGRSADNHGGNHGQLVASASQWRRGTQMGKAHRSSEARRQRRQNKGDDLDAPHADAGQLRGRAIAAGRAHVVAERCPSQYEAADDDETDHPEYLNWDLSDFPVKRGEETGVFEARYRPGRLHEGNAAQNIKHSKRDDERGDPTARRNQAVDYADDRRKHQHDEQGQPEIDPKILGDEGHRQRAEAVDRADREIQFLGGEEKRHRHAHDGQLGHLAAHRQQIPAPEERRPRPADSERHDNQEREYGKLAGAEYGRESRP
jgi:hypothetical protein